MRENVQYKHNADHSFDPSSSNCYKSLIDYDKINRIVNVISHKTRCQDEYILEDMKGEIILALLENKITDNEIATYGFKFYKKMIDNRRVFIDVDTETYGFNPRERYWDSFNNNKAYNPALVEKVYELHASGMTYRKIGITLGISNVWALYQVQRTLHLPIISPELKMKAIEASENNRARILSGINLTNKNTFKCGVSNINAKLTPQKVKAMRKRYADGESTKVLADEYGVSSGVARYAIIGKTWKHVK